MGRLHFILRNLPATLFTLLFLAGCSIQRPDPKMEMTELAPENWGAPYDSGEVADDWLTAFNDPILQLLVEEAQLANPSLAQTAATLSAAIAQARQANSALFPSVNAGAQLDQTHIFELTEFERGLGIEKDTTSFGVSLDLSWEIDVWSRISDSAKGAALAAQATAADYAFARQSLTAQVAKAWFQAITAKQQMELADSFVVLFAESFRLAEARFNAGDVSAQDTFTARADLANARQRAEEAQFAAQSSVRSIEILLGRYPADELEIAGPLERELPVVPAGLPSQILERRPDLIAADRQVASSFFLASSASAARLPQFSLGASYSTTADKIGDLFDGPGSLAQLGINLFQPLFDAGLLKSQFEEAEAEQMQAVALYKATVLNAFQEVEDTLSLEKFLYAQVANLVEAAQSYEKARQIGEIRYREGETNLTEYLDVQRQALSAQQSLISARGQLLTNRVDLYLALGGNFAEGPTNTTPAPPPLPSQEEE